MTKQHVFFETLMTDTQDKMPAWLLKRWPARDFDALHRINGYKMPTIIMGLKKGKTCAEEDGVVAEMLQILSDETYEFLAALYKLGLLIHGSADLDNIWDWHTLVLLE